MSNSLELHPVEEYLNIQQSRISEFSKNHPDISRILGTCFNVSRMLMVTIGHQPSLSLVETHRLVMWQSVTEYQVQSLILILTGKLDSGHALLRLATELSRDVHCIGDDESRLTLWLDKEKRRQEYRTLFKFDDTSDFGKTVHDIYKFCSQFGVHGHRTTSAFSEPVGRTGKNDCLLLIDVTDLAILDAVQIWLMAFVSIQHLCASTFFERHLVELQEPLSHFASLEILMGDIVRELNKSLRDLRQSKSTIPSEKFS